MLNFFFFFSVGDGARRGRPLDLPSVSDLGQSLQSLLAEQASKVDSKKTCGKDQHSTDDIYLKITHGRVFQT